MTTIRCGVICLVMVGCGLTPTSQLDAKFDLKILEGHLYANAIFVDVSSDRFAAKLDDGDRVSLMFRGQTARLANDDGFYFGGLDLDRPPEADEIVKIFLDRDGNADTTSLLALPPPLIIEPVPLFVSRSTDFVIRWSPITDDPMSWEATGGDFDSCLPGGGSIPPSASSLTIPATMAGLGMIDPGTCTAQLTLTRTRTRPGAPGFGASTIVFTQQQEIEFASTP